MTEKKKKVLYNPEASYRWEPLDIIEITGQQFASFYHALNQEINTPGGAPILVKYEAYRAMLDILQKAVEDGIVVEDIVEIAEQKRTELFQEMGKLSKVD